MLTYPNYVLIADETGCNANQKKYGHIAGTKYITKEGTQAQRMLSTLKRCFTIYPFLAANEKPVCCVVIFHSKQPSPNFEWAHGIDIKNNQLGMNVVKWFKWKIRVQRNIILMDQHAHSIVCLTFSSKSRGIAAEILIDILKYFDRKEIFSWLPGGPISFLLVDRYKIQLDPMFIANINNIDHRWKVCFGVPYATSL